MTTIEVQGDHVIKKKGDQVVSDKDLPHVIAGYQGVINSDSRSEEAKQHAREQLELLQHRVHAKEQSQGAGSDHESSIDLQGKSPTRVLAGMKAAMHNPRVTEAKKEELEDKIEHLQEEIA